MIYFIALLAFAFTLLGGWFALRFSDRLHLMLGFSAGAVIGVAFFDLLPEALELGERLGASTITMIIGFSFMAYLVLDRLVLFHPHADEECHNEDHRPRGWLSAGTLSIHSFLDGLAIGLAWQVSVAVGLVVTLAVLAHDFSDGINTVGVILKSGAPKSEAWRWLSVDAIAPVLGILVSTLFTLTEQSLGVVLAVFCGFFLYIGASELLPESHHGHPTRWTTIATLLGLGVIFVVVKIAGI
ncbi:MAG: ZIP family metal transporter [Candidatus Paceibacterota bacterium]|jgi:ZIP family zinc transporter